MAAERPSPAELFNAALEAFCSGDIEEAAACLRAGFFENMFLAAELLGLESEKPAMWHPGAYAEPRAAQEYVSRYGKLWDEHEDALQFLAEVWSDPLVRSEIRSFVNMSKAILQTQNEHQQADLIRERERFGDLRRIRRTQSEILERLSSGSYRRPLEQPRLSLILLAARSPAQTVEFYRQLFEMEPVRTSRLAGGYAEFDLPGVRLAVHGHDRLGQGDPYGLGDPPASLGWGAIFVIRTGEFDRYLDNALRAGLEIVDRDLQSPGKRFFLVKDPSGYLLEITEEAEPQGL
ncbi:MAG: VOC family protein [Planctomycetes bacterium]|nr:VOC family protein [Planctomycetota bacterium]